MEVLASTNRLGRPPLCEMGEVGRDQRHSTENAAHESVSESREHGEGYGTEH
jgi:hypothetical protein